jgi:hypothetical protein
LLLISESLSNTNEVNNDIDSVSDDTYDDETFSYTGVEASACHKQQQNEQLNVQEGFDAEKDSVVIAWIVYLGWTI